MIDSFSPKNIVVIGDFLLDAYTYGDVERISPEAPVPVLHVQKQEALPGGAGNTVLNLLSMGMNVCAIGRMGSEIRGSKLLEILVNEGVDTKGVLIDSEYETPEKRRCIAHGQQLLRIDYERFSLLSPEKEALVCKNLPQILENADLVAISDYGKGFVTPRICIETIRLCRFKKIPVIVDPKGRNYSHYAGATVLKPNMVEAIEASGLERTASLEGIACKLMEQVPVDYLMITRSQNGISLFKKGEEIFHIPAYVQEVTDVTGAGDTVLAMLATAMANGFSIRESMIWANKAAAVAVKHVGCARVTLEEIQEILESTLKEPLLTQSK